jgi:hypothetical protein
VEGWVDSGRNVTVATGSGVSAGVWDVGDGCGAAGVSLAGGEGEGITVPEVLETGRQASSQRPRSKRIEKESALFVIT